MEQRIRFSAFYLMFKYCSKIGPGAYCTESGYNNIKWK